MTGAIPLDVRVGQSFADPHEVDDRPPGERYFRHPGDLVRLVLWGVCLVVLAIFISVATATSDGVTSDLGRAAGRVAVSVREFTLALNQVVAAGVPVVIVLVLAGQRRWRRLALLMLAAATGAAFFALLDLYLDVSQRVADAVTSGTWIASTRFPSLAYVAGVAAAAVVGKPWLTRPWRRAVDVAVVLLAVVMAFAGSAGVPPLLLAIVTGAFVGSALLVAFGAPNRRPSPSAVALALQDGGLGVTGLALQRAEGGRAQLYRAELANGREAFVKVYGRDSRDADVLYRATRTLLFRGPNDDWPSVSVERDVEHEALLLMSARQAGVRCPTVEALASLADGSMALALENVSGHRLDELSADDIDADLLDAIFREANAMHRSRVAHRSLRTANILVQDGRPVIIDMSFAKQSAPPRLLAIDRAELLASLAALVGVEPVVAAAARVLDPDDLAAAEPYLQPLALSSATRHQVSKPLLKELRTQVAAVTGEEPPPLERLVRVRARTLLMIATGAGAFYFLLPQLANVGDSFRALRSASWGWLIVCIALSFVTYIAAAIATAGGVPDHLPFVANTEAQMASSFVNRVTPANVGGMALNVRFMQKAGVDPPAAVTGVGLNAAAGAIVHLVLLVLFFAWAQQTQTSSFKIPASSKVLAALAVVLAIVGIGMATRWGRRLVREHVWRWVKQSFVSMATLARSPAKLAALFGGSAGITLAYICALAAATQAFGGGVTFAQVGAVYLGASLIAAAAPTPGGLGAMEAALVAGFTGVGLDSGVAVASVLSYRLATYWFPILPGWISFQVLQRRNLI